MEIRNINNDIKVFYVKAESFPNGIKAAHEKLHSLLPSAEGRRFFGISYQGSNGNIIYKAAAEELQKGESEKYGCETFIIKKGEYISETLNDWQKDKGQVDRTFKKLLADPRLDENGYCLEMYPNEKDMMCMVKLDSSKEDRKA
ncbi:MAG: transcriptional regulator [Ignavibacteria bacterium]